MGLGVVLGRATSSTSVFILAFLSKGASTKTIETDAVAATIGVAPVSPFLREVVRRGRFVLGVVVRFAALVANIPVSSRA